MFSFQELVFHFVHQLLAQEQSCPEQEEAMSTPVNLCSAIRQLSVAIVGHSGTALEGLIRLSVEAALVIQEDLAGAFATDSQEWQAEHQLTLLAAPLASLSSQILPSTKTGSKQPWGTLKHVRLKVLNVLKDWKKLFRFIKYTLLRHSQALMWKI